MEKGYLQVLPRGQGMVIVTENVTSLISKDKPRDGVTKAFYQPCLPGSQNQVGRIYCRNCTTVLLKDKNAVINAISELFSNDQIDINEFDELQIYVDTLVFS